MKKNNFNIPNELKEDFKIIHLDENNCDKFLTINPEIVHFFLNVEKINFNVYARKGSQILTFIQSGKNLHSSTVFSMIEAMANGEKDFSFVVERKDRKKLTSMVNILRDKKIHNLRKRLTNLDSKTLDIYSSLSAAASSIVAGGLDEELVNNVRASASYVVSNSLNSEAALDTLSRMISCDPTLYDHSAAVALIAAVISKNLLKTKLSSNEIEVITQSALYHDVGKSCVPNHILNKPGKFSSEEFEIMKQHTSHGERELQDAVSKGANIHPACIRVACEHHEKFEGGGYPKNHKGRLEEDPKGIHLFTRIVSIADVYSALLMKRVYKEAFSPRDTLETMVKMSNSFDPEIFKPFALSLAATIKKSKAEINGIKNTQIKKEDTGRIIFIDKKTV